MAETHCPYSIGSFVMHHGGPVLVNDSQNTESRGWVYGLTFSQTNMCADDKWQSGGCVFWVGHDELSPVTDPVLTLRVRRWEAQMRIDERNRLNKADEAIVRSIATAQEIMAGAIGKTTEDRKVAEQ